MRHPGTLKARLALAVSSVVFSAGLTFSADLPTAKSIAAEMGFCWNIGNTMEAPNDPTSWGNPLPNQQLIDSVKAGGFKTIRIPCAWDSHADNSSDIISETWLTQVKQVVDYCIRDSLFVVLNIHWDGGWLEENISAEKQADVNKKQGAYWRQIATFFRNYDRHLLFASANEPAVQDAYGTAFGDDRMAILNSYHQTFIDTVRATGGNNASRTLIVQGPHSDIELTDKVMNTMPVDKIADRLMAECHFYPYQFTIMEQDADWGKVFYYWGKDNHSTTDTSRNATWCEENYVDSMFTILKRKFVDKNIPVLLGEYGAMKRMTLNGDTLLRHIQSRRSFYNYVMSSAKSHSIIPAAWDAGGKGDKTMTIFDRKTGSIFDLGLLNAIRSGWGMSKLPGDTSLVTISTGANAMKALYSCTDSTYGQVELGVVKMNWSTYDSIIVRAYVNGETSYDSAGSTKNGWVSLSLVTMSKNWTWREGSFGQLTMNDWNNYSIPISSDTSDKEAMVPADPAKIDFFALQAYSHGYHGTIYLDWIVFKTKSGVSDTLYNFNLTPDVKKANVVAVSLIPVSDVDSDQEWKTATTEFGTTVINRRNFTNASTALYAHTVKGNVMASYTAASAGTAKATLINLQGKTIISSKFNLHAGKNTLLLSADYHGMMIMHIEKGDKILSCKVISD